MSSNNTVYNRYNSSVPCVFKVENCFLIAPFPDHCLLVPFYVGSGYFAGPGKIAIFDLQAILPDQILIKNFILYFVRYSNLHFCFIYLFISLRYFSISRLLFVPFL